LSSKAYANEMSLNSLRKTCKVVCGVRFGFYQQCRVGGSTSTTFETACTDLKNLLPTKSY
jgi:hypothetical protein